MLDTCALNTKELIETFQIYFKTTVKIRTEIAMVCGADSIITLDHRTPESNPIVCVSRPNYSLDREISKCKFKHRILSIPEWEGPDISATQIRHLLSHTDYSPEASNKLLQLVPPSVFKSIINPPS